MTDTRPHVVLTRRFADAVEYAASLHAAQARKGTTIPYVAHLLGAASFVLEQDGTTEDQAIAALLHDAVEDQPHATSVEEIAARFGQVVAGIVADCTDADTDPKPPWRWRKEAYLGHLRGAPVASLQVSLADKLHNARAIATDLERDGPALWARFSAPPVAQRWYYTSLAAVFAQRLGPTPTVRALEATVAAMVEGIPAALDLPPLDDRPAWVGAGSVTAAVASAVEAVEVVSAQSPAGSDATLRTAGTGAQATTADGRWWVESVDAGDPARPITVFIRPQHTDGREGPR